jgi:ceramide glucosyltransferase
MGILGIIVFILSILLALAALVHLVVWAGALFFVLSKDRYARVHGYTPPVSIIKPARGLAIDDEENFRSFFAIEYPVFEILFVVHEDAKNDPAIPLIERLIAEHPSVDARLIRASSRIAVHEKVNNYIDAIAQAKHSIINITDADAYVRPDHLAREVKPLSDPRNAMVFSVQTMNHFQCSAAAFEGLYQNGDYPPVLMVIADLGLTRFVIGHSIFFRREEFYSFDAIGILKDHLIDDQGWGEVMVDRGKKRIWMSKAITHTRYPKTTWKKASDHILRWGAFFYRFTPLYVIVPLLQCSALAFLTLLLAALLPAAHPLRLAGMLAGGCMFAIRMLNVIASNLAFADNARDLRWAWTIPLRDVYTVWVAIASPFVRFFTHAEKTYKIEGSRIRERGEPR